MAMTPYQTSPPLGNLAQLGPSAQGGDTTWQQRPPAFTGAPLPTQGGGGISTMPMPIPPQTAPGQQAPMPMAGGMPQGSPFAGQMPPGLANGMPAGSPFAGQMPPGLQGGMMPPGMQGGMPSGAPMGGGDMVMMRGPDGMTHPAPRHLVPMFQQMGGQVIG